ncbi:MAG: magnesium transporter, partial [Clostridia bacterium]
MDFDKVKELMDNKSYSQLRSVLETAQPVDVAEYIDILEEKQALLVFRLLPKEIAADVFSYLSSERQLEISDLVNEKELADIISDLYFDDKVDFLEEMPAYVVKKILKNTTDVERKMINQFLMYPDFSAGSLMTIEYIDLKKEMLIGEALDRIRRTAPDKETIYTCYVIDAARHLQGIISLKDIVLAPVEKKVGDIMKRDPIFVRTHDDQEYTADIFKKYDLLALPVVDNEQRLVGIITIDDIVDVIEKETTEDFYKMAAVQHTDEEYISASIFTLAKKRILWLLILMISAIFTGYILRHHEHTLAQMIALVAFIPMLMDTGGNAGAQASTLVIRSLVLNEITTKDFIKVVWKEIRVSFLVGIGLGALNFLRIFFFESSGFGIALVVAIT